MVSPPSGSQRAPSPATIAEVAVNAPLGKLFHYEVPAALVGRLERGHRVLVPFGRRTTTGVCTGFPEKAQVERLKPIREILQPECRFDDHLLELTRWMATYYHASWGEVLEAALPPGIRKARRKKPERFVRTGKSSDELGPESEKLARRAPSQARVLEHLGRDPGPHRLADLGRELGVAKDSFHRLCEKGLLEIFEEEPEDDAGILERALSNAAAVIPGALDLEQSDRPQLELHADQKRALEVILAEIEAQSGEPPKPILIHGVTGSGKTEVYLRALDRVLRDGGRGLVLVPEISLTPQTVKRFRDHLPGVGIAVLHSMLTSRERTEEWREIQAGRVGVVIGARSAVFSPIPDLRLIVVDEEHESSYKQESSPRYNGRDIAILRARLLGVPVILGSATPSLESYHNARTGRYRLVEMPRRATPHGVPSISILTLGKEFYRPDGNGLISHPLDYQIRKCLERGEQTILFLNRRGFSTFLHCLRCSHVMRCEHCDIALTYHRREEQLLCHYCDSEYRVPRACPECTFTGLRRSGVGTEKVAEVISKRYENATVARLDRDTIKNHRSLRSTLESFATGKTDILVGTQMLAKGHDFPRVSLVGIISADTGLHFPDFRSAERTFQLITQVAGRAGRGERAGTVILQTFFPDHYAIELAVAGDYRKFYDAETEHREALSYPPFGRVARIVIQDEKQERGEKSAERIARRLRRVESDRDGVEVLGPAPSPIARVQERFRFQILVKCATAGLLQEVLRAGNVHTDGRLSAQVAVDVDPQSML